jgi:outer membrane protein assembly factor BamB
MRAWKELLGLFCVCGLAAGTLRGAGPARTSADWPAWRGPTYDGQSPEVPRAMPALKRVWQKKMAGTCHAGLVATAGFVVAADSDKANDYYRCYEAETGKEAWSQTVANGRKMDYGAAPRATPLIHQGKVFCLGAFGDLRAFDLKTGKALWSKDFVRDFGAKEPPTWGFCSSPVAAGSKVVVLVGGPKATLAALDANSGRLVWSGEGGGPNYAGIIVGTFGGVRQVVGYDSAHLAGWDAATGKRLWHMEVDVSNGYVVPTPVAVGGKLLVASENECTRLFAFDKGGRIKTKPEAENEDLAPEIGSPVVCGGIVLGCTDGLIGLDLRGKLKTLWIEEDVKELLGLLTMVAWKDRAMIFGDEGHLVLVAPDRSGCKVLGKAKLCNRTWVHPALARGRLFVRDDKTLYCYELSAPTPPAAPGRGAGKARPQ